MQPRIKVLLITASATDRACVCQLTQHFKRTSVCLDHVSTYAAALHELRQQRHDVYLIDQQVGDASGFDLIRAVHGFTTTAPMILLTDQDNGQTDEAASAAGAADCLSKADLQAPLLEHALRCALKHVQVVQTVRETEERFRIVTESASDALITIDHTNTMVYVNPATEAIFGYRCADLIGQPLDLLIKPQAGAEQIRGVQRFIGSQQRSTWRAVEIVGRRHNGQDMPLEASFAEFTQHGTTWVTAIIRDISERKQAEAIQARLAAIVDATPNLVGIATVDGQILYLNPAGRSMMAIHATDDVSGMHIAQAYAPHVREHMLHTAVPHAIEHGLWTGEAILHGREGHDVPVTQTIIAHRSKHGDLEYLSTVAQDIAALKQIEHSLHVRIRQQAAVAELGQCALDGAPLIDLFNQATKLVAQGLQIKYCTLLELLPHQQAFCIRAYQGWQLDAPNLILPFAQAAQADYTLLHNQPLIVEDTTTETRFPIPPVTEAHGIRSSLSLVIRGPHQPFGVIGVHTTHPRHFSTDDISFVQSIANVLAAAIERAQTEGALRESEVRFRKVVEGLGEGLLITNLDDTILYTNSQMTTLVGLSSEDMIGQRAAALLLPPPDQHANHAWLEQPHDGQRAQFETQLRHASGKPIWVLVHATPYHSAMGDIVGTLAAFTDISERKAAEESLRESEERFRQLAENVDDVFYVTDRETGTLLYLSPTFEKVWGRSRETMTDSAALLQTIHPEDRARMMADFPAALPHVPAEIEYRIVRPDGSIRWIWDRAFPVHDHAGRIIRTTGLAQDITDRKQARDALREYASQLRLITTQMPLLLWTTDKNLTINSVLGTGLVQLNLDFNQVLGTSIYDQMQHRQRGHEPINAHMRALSGESAVYEWRTRNYDFAVRVEPLRDEQHAIIGCVSLAIDITQHKQAERRSAAFAALGYRLSSATDAREAAHVIADVADELLGWDAFSLVLYSANGNTLHCVLNIDEIDGKRTVVPSVEPEAAPSHLIVRTMQEGPQLLLPTNPSLTLHGSLPFGDTDQPSASLMFVPLRSGMAVIGVVSIQSYTPNAYTTTHLETLQALADHCGSALERVRAEDELRHLNAQLEQRVAERTAQLQSANNELEAFSYSVSHDLRAPLRSIDGFSQALLEDYGDQLDANGHDYLRRVRNATHRMGQLIDDLLNLSRVSRGELRRSVVDLSLIAHTIAFELRQTAPDRQVVFRVSDGLIAHGDPHLLYVLLSNLLGNAWKFTAKQPHAQIEFGTMDHNGVPHFYVRDNGAGFAMTYSSKLFGPFQRLHAPDEFEGTGIGLATVKRIVDRHGGHIFAVGAIDQGATFMFTV